MKQNKKRMFIGIATAITVIVLTFIIVCLLFDVSFSGNSADDEQAEYVKIINETYPTDIMLVGGDVGFPDALNTRGSLKYRIRSWLQKSNICFPY